MEKGDQGGSEEWRLGIELGEHAVHPGPQHAGRPSAADPATARLERPLYVLTAEHLGWILIAAYAIATRLLALGARPLTPAEAGAALTGLAAVRHGLAPHPASWVVLAQSGIFAALGASDFTVRLFAAGCGILLVAVAFAMRPYLGRAGALAMGAMLAISPTVLWFSRAGTTAMPAIAFATVAVALLIASMRRPGMSRAIGFAAAAALAMSASAVGIVAAVTAAAAGLIVGIYSAIAGGNAILRIRVWWTRRAVLVIVAAIAGLAVWVVFTTVFFSRILVKGLIVETAPLLGGAGGFDFVRGLAFYAPIYFFYEFAIGIAALAGIAAIVTVRVRSAFAVWLALWTLLSAAAYAAAPGDRPQFVLGVIVPAAMLGAVGIDWIFRTGTWNVAAYLLAAVAAAAVYSQALTSVIYPAPNATEAPWARHALLFWSEPATTWQARNECENAERSAKGGTVAYAEGIDAPAVRWYLRGMKPAVAGAPASIAVTAAVSDTPTPVSDTTQSQFVLEQEWSPALAALTPRGALRYYLSAHAWTPMRGRELAMTVHPPEHATPSAGGAPSPLPVASASATVTPTETPAPTITPTPVATAAPASAASRASSPTATATPRAKATPSATPSPTPSTTPSPTATSTPSAAKESKAQVH